MTTISCFLSLSRILSIQRYFQNAEMQRAVARESSASVGSIYGHGDTYRELREVSFVLVLLGVFFVVPLFAW